MARAPERESEFSFPGPLRNRLTCSPRTRAPLTDATPVTVERFRLVPEAPAG